MLSSLIQDPVNTLIYLLLKTPGVLLAFSVHEAAHAFMSYKLGDPTAKLTGRLSLNPFKHFDPIGLLALLVFGFGWGRPVQVNTRYFKNPKRDMCLTALAGPVSNFIAAFFMLLIARLLFIGYAANFDRFGETTFTVVLMVIYELFYYGTIVNLGLGVFNLIPIPPLDGWKVLGSFLSPKSYFKIMEYERYGMFLLIALLVLGVLDIPLMFLNNALYGGYNAAISALFGLFGA